MKTFSALVAAAVFVVSVAAGGPIAAAQGPARRIGAVVSGGDSIVINAPGFSLISTMVWSGRTPSLAVATTTNARTWVRSADSIARVVSANPGHASRVDPVELVAARGSLSYVRVLGVSDAAAHEIESTDATAHQLVRVSLSTAQLDLLLQYMARAADVSDSLTVVARQAVSSLRKPEGQAGNAVYFEFQVEKRAIPDAQNAPPTYPAMLRSAGIEGQVLAQFVVDTAGLVEPSTFKVLKSPHILFTNAVHMALPNMRFSPAEVGGVKVRQLVQMPFTFTLPPLD